MKSNWLQAKANQQAKKACMYGGKARPSCMYGGKNRTCMYGGK